MRKQNYNNDIQFGWNGGDCLVDGVWKQDIKESHSEEKYRIRQLIIHAINGAT